jgi:hypothetical protein
MVGAQRLAVSLRSALLSEILRGPGKTHSDVIHKLVELEAKGRR